MRKFKIIGLILILFTSLSFAESDKPIEIKEIQKEILINNKTTESIIYEVYIDSDIVEPAQYRNLFYKLRIAKKEDIFIFKINTYGGRIDTVIHLYNEIKRTKACTLAEIYKAYSAGAIIVMACNKVKVMKFGSFMMHNISTGSAGKISDIKTYTDHACKLNIALVKTIFKDFFTKKEIEDLFKGRDIWFEEEELKKRFKKMGKLDEKI